MRDYKYIKFKDIDYVATDVTLLDSNGDNRTVTVVEESIMESFRDRELSDEAEGILDMFDLTLPIKVFIENANTGDDIFADEIRKAYSKNW